MSSFLIANSLPNDCQELDDKPKADQTWKVWKDTFNPLHKNFEHKTRLARGGEGGGGSFGAAADAQLIHVIDPSTVPALFCGETLGLLKGENLGEEFDAHFDNSATTAMHSNDILQRTLGQLTQSSTNQHN